MVQSDDTFFLGSTLKFHAGKHERCRLIDRSIDNVWYNALTNGTCT